MARKEAAFIEFAEGRRALKGGGRVADAAFPGVVAIRGANSSLAMGTTRPPCPRDSIACLRTSHWISARSSGSYLSSAPLAERELSPQVRAGRRG